MSFDHSSIFVFFADNLNNNDDNDAELRSFEPEHINFPSNYCQCTIESIVPLYSEAYRTTNTNKSAEIMRDMTSSGTLRGLLKKPNRPPPSQKNRVIFDETRNEFFDADYIILVRDDCPYDEEDEEPCTCGEHELVRLCCDEGCQCTAYPDDGRTPQVISKRFPFFLSLSHSFLSFSWPFSLQPEPFHRQFEFSICAKSINYHIDGKLLPKTFSLDNFFLTNSSCNLSIYLFIRFSLAYLPNDA